jgi:epoxyqueuosine reductase
VRPVDPPPPPADPAYVAELVAVAAAHGITHSGIAGAEPLARARAEMERRTRLGLHGELPFTYRDIARSTDPQRAVGEARAIFVGALPYPSAEPPSPGAPAARVARYAWADHYATLRAGLWAVAHRLRADGWKAVAFADDNSVVDREVAYRAGIGWFGKNANLLVPGAGSFFVLGSVVTTAPLPAAVAPQPDGCGSCTRCVKACPTAAIVGPGVIDARRCLAWVLQRPGPVPAELREAVGDRIYGCDDCQTSCPATVRGLQVGHSRPADAWVRVLDLLDAGDDEILDRYGRWYIAERDPRWLRRNALVVLGNVGDAADPRVAAVLARYRSGRDELLAEHAEWAAQRLGLAVPA